MRDVGRQIWNSVFVRVLNQVESHVGPLIWMRLDDLKGRVGRRVKGQVQFRVEDELKGESSNNP